MKVPGPDHPRLPAPDPSWRTLQLEAADDEAIEAQFALDRGLVAERRARPDVRVLVVRGEGRDPSALGLACVDPHFPGASPFAAVSARAAHALLAALQPPAAEAGELTVVIHDDPELARALVEAGAREVLETVHYRGRL